jgi:hypothetical protein
VYTGIFIPLFPVLSNTGSSPFRISPFLHPNFLVDLYMGKFFSPFLYLFTSRVYTGNSTQHFPVLIETFCTISFPVLFIAYTGNIGDFYSTFPRFDRNFFVQPVFPVLFTAYTGNLEDFYSSFPRFVQKYFYNWFFPRLVYRVYGEYLSLFFIKVSWIIIYKQVIYNDALSSSHISSY